MIWNIIFSICFTILLIMLILFIKRFKPEKFWSILLLYTTVLQLLVNIVEIFEKWGK